MKPIEKRLRALEQAKTAHQPFNQIIIYDPAIGPPNREANWPACVVFIPSNGREKDSAKYGLPLVTLTPGQLESLLP